MSWWEFGADLDGRGREGSTPPGSRRSSRFWLSLAGCLVLAIAISGFAFWRLSTTQGGAGGPSWAPSPRQAGRLHTIATASRSEYSLDTAHGAVHFLPGVQPRRHHPGPPAGGNRHHARRLPAVADRDGWARRARSPRLHHPAAVLLHRARRVRSGAPHRPDLPGPGRLPAQRHLPAAAEPVQPDGDQHVRPGTTGRFGSGAWHAGPRRYPGPGQRALDRERVEVDGGLDHRGGVGPVRHRSDRPEEPARPGGARPLLL